MILVSLREPTLARNFVGTTEDGKNVQVVVKNQSYAF